MTRTPRRGSGPRARAALLGVALAWPLAASAYRPFDSTDAAVAPRGGVEIELGPLGYLARGAEREVVAPALVLNWGFADRLEAVLEGRHLLEVGGAAGGPRRRIEDAALSVKGVVREGGLQEKAGVSLATELSALLPAPDGERGAGAQCTLVASRRWPALTVHVSGAAAWTRAHAPAAFAGVIVEGHDAWRLRPVAEAFVERERGLPATASGLLGAIWRATGALSLDAALRLARAGGPTTAEIRVGLTWGFGAGVP